MKKPKNYYCHRNLSEVQAPVISNRALEVVEKIGEGSFGQVYKVFDPSSSQLAVLKKFKKEAPLSQEAKILSQLTNSQGFDRLKTNTNISSKPTQEQPSETGRENEILMGYLGPSTGSIMKRIKRMNVYSVKRIACQALNRLKQIHAKLYVHRDIKPDNILFGNKYDSHTIYLIDFGLTAAYRRTAAKARKMFQSLVGTARYCPVSSHLGLEQYPKDDLESLGYVLLYFMAGELPWDKEDTKDDEQFFQRILKRKEKCSIEELCQGVNCLRKYWTTVKSLKIGEKINYQELIDLFDVGDPKQENCYEFCQKCWTRTHANFGKSKSPSNEEAEINFEPRSSFIRQSILQ